MLFVRAPYGVKSPGAYFSDLLAEQFRDLGYTPSIADPDVWMIPEVKPDGFMYYYNLLFYVDGVICISDYLICAMKGIQDKFKLKGYKIEEPYMYLGAELSKITKTYGQEC